MEYLEDYRAFHNGGTPDGNDWKNALVFIGILIGIILVITAIW